MKTIDIKAQIIDDHFQSYRVNTERNVTAILPEIIHNLQGEKTVSAPGGYQLLIARQVTYPENESLNDLHINAGEFLILYRPSMAHVKLVLHLPKQFDAPPFTIDKTDACIGRSSEYSPDIDLEEYLTDPTVVSRKVAWLQEDDGKWYIGLDPDCHSGLFINEARLRVGIRLELQDRAVLTFGNSIDKPDLRLGVSLVTQ